MTKLTLLALSTVALVAIASPASAKKNEASSKGPSAKTKPLPAAVKDCAADGDLDRVYSPGALLNALKRFPADVGTYTDCADVLRFARSAGPVLPVGKTTARLRARCVGSAYGVTISVKGTTVGTATVPSCKSGGTKLVRVPVTTSGAKKTKRHDLATVVAKPDGKTLRFVVRLSGRKL
ncbi:MAG: hypothetical protein JWO02_1161 [Solirubrobacterales bacterium]|nr:hypothetical protein [Solirubrobacterales bacterium]